MLGNPDELDALARRLDDRATDVRAQALRVANEARAMRWDSAGAAAFRQAVAGDRRQLYGCAEDLQAAAARLRSHAQTVRERVAEIRRIATAVTNWFEGAAGDAGNALESVGGAALDLARGAVNTFGDLLHGEPPWHDWPITSHSLPAPDSIEWLHAGDFFRKQGIN